VLLTIALTVVFTGIDQLRIVLANSAMDIGLLDSLLPDSGGPANLAHAYSAPSPQPCGAQLGAAGYSVTLTDTPQASAPFRQALGLQASDLVPEFTSISGSVAALQNDASAVMLGLDRMYVVNPSHFAGTAQQAVIEKLQGEPDVASAEPVWLQTSDPKYLTCGYNLEGNATAQSVAALARSALIAHGVSAARLDDAGTAQFVSERHFNGQLLLQVAFVRRPVGEPSVVYVAILSLDGKQALAVARANWYSWSE
jgi:hypothetical protein